ncbi:MAG TPA: FAD-binding oxidoreductase [Acidobacteriaceae bacterium]
MDRRTLLKRLAAVPLLPTLLPYLSNAEQTSLPAKSGFHRVRPGDPSWPSAAKWEQLKQQVGGNLIPVEFPLTACQRAFESASCQDVFERLDNPYSIGDQPGLTQTLGWANAWTTEPSVYAVAARSADHIAAAVSFARENRLRLVVKGGGHSYQGTSNAPDSLLIWTRHMNDITMYDAFVPQGCEGKQEPQRAVTLGAGAIWIHAYDAVTTRGDHYVQGGGCTTVGVAGLIQSGGFGSFSKHYGLAAAGLLEAEVVTADGKIHVANACTNPDLFWALKGGGGGSFGVVSKVTLRVRELPEFFGGAIFTIKAASDDGFRRLLHQFFDLYRTSLFNDRWGEQAHINRDNSLTISMVSYGVDGAQAKEIWQPFLDWVTRSPSVYTLKAPPIIGSLPPQKWWDAQWRERHQQTVFVSDTRPDARPGDVWWTGDAGQVGQFLYGFESLWLPASLLEEDSQERIVNALFASSRHWGVELHFNKGLAGAPADAIASARDTATNPAVLDAFALAIIASGEGHAYPGLRGYEPNLAAARKEAAAVAKSMDELRRLVPNGGSYVSESNFFERYWQQSYWGSNYPRLRAVKAKYDPDGLFFVHHGVGSEEWSPDGFTRLAEPSH